MRWTSSSVRSLVRLVGSICASEQTRLAVVVPMPYTYVSEIWICFSRGRSTPEIRAMRLPLPLLVARVRGADHAHHALAADHLALHADLPDRSTNLHGFLPPQPEQPNRISFLPRPHPHCRKGGWGQPGQ